MPKYFAILIAGMSALCASASQAATSEICENIRDYAYSTMEARQAGVSYEKLSLDVEINYRENEKLRSLFLSIIGGAFLEDRQTTKAAQAAAVNAYGRAWYHSCVWFMVS